MRRRADTLAPALHTASAGQDRIATRADAPIGALLPHEGAMLARWGEAWHRVDADGAVQPASPTHVQGLRGRFSASCVDPRGQPWLCSADGERWRVASPGGREGFSLPEPASALAWSPAGDVLYLAAADSGTVWTTRPGHTGLRRLATLPKGSGTIAGLAVDAEGGVWTALRGGWGVLRLQGDGTLDRMVALPVPCPTGVAFGGDDGRTLFITSARDAIGREALDAAPLSGRLFALAT
jgi:IclR family acetate operon transcriptional repressor